MDNLHRAIVTLGFSGEELLPEELTALLGHPPDLGVHRGESFVGHHGHLITPKFGRWDFGTDWRERPCIDEMICEVLLSLAEGNELWRDLTTRFDCYVSVGLYFYEDSWTGGITLKPRTLQMLGERGLAIDFDMYAPGAQEVFSVEHVHVVSDDEEQVETIGIYSQKNRAEDAVKRASELDGFKHQVEGFSIVPVNIDRDYWEEGMSATGRKLTIGS